MEECKRYGKLKNMQFVPGRWRTSKRDGEPIPDHCFSQEGPRISFNQYMTGHNASLSRKKLCVCRGFAYMDYNELFALYDFEHLYILTIIITIYKNFLR